MAELRKKLQLKQQNLALVRLPSELERSIAQELFWTKYDTIPEVLPESVLVFAKNQAELEELIPSVLERATAQTILWFAYPKRNSTRYQTDIARDRGWEAMEDAGYIIARQISLDSDWSALRYVKDDAEAMEE